MIAPKPDIEQQVGKLIGGAAYGREAEYPPSSKAADDPSELPKEATVLLQTPNTGSTATLGRTPRSTQHSRDGG